MQDDSYWFNFILLHMDISVSQHCLLKFFSLACVSGIFVTEMADVMCTHIWVFDYCSNGQHVCSCASSIFGFGGLFLFPPPLFFFWTGSIYVVMVVLELSVWAKLTSDSQILEQKCVPLCTAHVIFITLVL